MFIKKILKFTSLLYNLEFSRCRYLWIIITVMSCNCHIGQSNLTLMTWGRNWDISLMVKLMVQKKIDKINHQWRLFGLDTGFVEIFFTAHLNIFIYWSLNIFEWFTSDRNCIPASSVENYFRILSWRIEMWRSKFQSLDSELLMLSYGSNILKWIEQILDWVFYSLEAKIFLLKMIQLNKNCSLPK